MLEKVTLKSETRKALTINRHAGLVDKSVTLKDAVREDRLAPRHVDRGGGELAEMNETGSAGS